MMDLLFEHIRFDWWMLAPVIGLGLILVWLGPPDNSNTGSADDPWGWRWRGGDSQDGDSSGE